MADYRIVDNGLRCFVEPCDSWDVINRDGKKVATVSRIQSKAGVRVNDIDPNRYCGVEVRQYQVAEGPNAGNLSLEVVCE